MQEVAIWEYLDHQRFLWIAFTHEETTRIEEAYQRGQDSMLLKGLVAIDFKYSQYTDTATGFIHDVRRTLLAAVLESPMHEHALVYSGGELARCFFCEQSSAHYRCMTPGCGYAYPYCVGCVAVQDYPTHLFSRLTVHKEMNCNILSCKNTFRKGGFKCKQCGFLIEETCFVRSVRESRCPRRAVPDEYHRRVWCSRLPRAPEKVYPYYVFWRRVGYSGYFFGPGLHNTYVVGRVDTNSIQILTTFKQIQKSRIGVLLSTIWHSLRKGEITLKYKLQTTFSVIVSVMQVIKELKKEEQQLFISSNSEITVLGEFRKSSASFGHQNSSVVQNVVIGMMMNKVEEGLTRALFEDIPPPDVSTPLIFSKSLAPLIPPSLVDSISEAIMEIRFSSTAEIECWENFFFSYIVSLIPVPGFKLCYSITRMLIFIYKGNKEEAIKSFFGILSGILNLITFFGVDLGLQCLFDLILNSSDALSSLVHVLQKALSSLGDFISPLEFFKKSVGQLQKQLTLGLSTSTIDAGIEMCSGLVIGLRDKFIEVNPSFSKFQCSESMLPPEETCIPILCRRWFTQRPQPCPPNCYFMHEIIDGLKIEPEMLQPSEKEKENEIERGIELFREKKYSECIEKFTLLLTHYQRVLNLNDMARITYFRGTSYYHNNQRDASITDTKVHLELLESVPAVREYFKKIMKEQPNLSSNGLLITDDPGFNWFIQLANGKTWYPVAGDDSEKIEIIYQSISFNDTAKQGIILFGQDGTIQCEGGGGGGEFIRTSYKEGSQWTRSGKVPPLRSKPQKVNLTLKKKTFELRRGSWFFLDELFIPYSMDQTEQLEREFRNPGQATVILTEKKKQRSVTRSNGVFRQFRLDVANSGREVLRGYDKIPPKRLAPYFDYSKVR